jgi:hypothetical protein
MHGMWYMAGIASLMQCAKQSRQGQNMLQV